MGREDSEDETKPQKRNKQESLSVTVKRKPETLFDEPIVIRRNEK